MPKNKRYMKVSEFIAETEMRITGKGFTRAYRYY